MGVTIGRVGFDFAPSSYMEMVTESLINNADYYIVIIFL